MAGFMQTFRYDAVDSTNDEAKRLLATVSDDTFVVVANEQTSGRGTQGRRWTSPPGAGLYFTLVKRYDASLPATTVFTQATGIACAEVLKQQYDLPVQLKPVNDIYLEGRKLGGVLTEATLREGEIQTLLTGVGINLLDTERTLDRIVVEPTCLEAHVSPEQMADLNPERLIKSLVGEIQDWHQAILDGKHDQIERAWSLVSMDEPIS